MSGILCVYDEAGVSEQLPRHLRALRRLAHRGSHGEGYRQSDRLFLGVTRCAVGNAVSSRQPIASADGAVLVAIDGHVHNRDALARDLRGRGVGVDLSSDPALVAALYSEHGESFVERLHGVFAFVLWDARSRCLRVGRDRLGVRPLYTYVSPRRVLVASEIKSLIQLEPEARVIDRERVRALLHHGRIDDWTGTCFAHVRPVPPGTVVRFDDGRPTSRRYWSLRPHTDRTLTPEALRECLVAAVERHTPEGVPVGLALSGGIDSAAIAGILTRPAVGGARTVHAFSVTPPHTTDESSLIDATVRQTGIRHTYVPLAGLDVARAIAQLVECHDEPVHYSGALYQFVLRQRMAEAGCRAVLVGYGADEIFAGYRELAPPFLVALAAGGRLSHAARFVHGVPGFFESSRRRIVGQACTHARVRARAAVLDAVKRTRMFRAYCGITGDRADSSGSPVPLDRELARAPSPHRDGYDLEGLDGGRPFFEALLRCFRTNIPLMVRQEDRNAMAHGLELCAPFLDDDLVRVALAVPFHRFMEGGWNKAMLRTATRDLLAPAVRAERRKLLTPGNDAHLAFDVLQPQFREWLHDRSFYDSGLWSRDCARSYEADAARRVRGHLWFRVYVVQQWYEQVVKGGGGIAREPAASNLEGARPCPMRP